MDKPKVVKIGIVTAGFILLLAGVLLLISIFYPMISVQLIASLWPLILIGLGIETLYYSSQKEIEIKFDIWACLFVIVVVGMCLVTYLIHYGIIYFASVEGYGFLK